MEAARASESFSRAEIRRILRISENSLRAWERAGLTASKASYTFHDLICLRTLDELRRSQIPAKRIRAALRQVRARLAHVRKPLDELKMVADGRRIAVEFSGGRMEAMTGQLLLDFDAKSSQPAVTLEFIHPDRTQPADATVTDAVSSDGWFQEALEMERVGTEPSKIIEVYRKVVECAPQAAGAWVNMGTLHYRQHRLTEAEQCYRRALDASAEYALAHFNLGNVCERTGRLKSAVRHLAKALELRPGYADAHFNMALAQERLRNRDEAVKHWRAYLNLDPSSPWSEIARRKHRSLLKVGARGSQG